MEQHHHPGAVGDGVVQTHPLAAALVHLKVADGVQDELLLFLGKDHLTEHEGGGGGGEGVE